MLSNCWVIFKLDKNHLPGWQQEKHNANIKPDKIIVKYGSSRFHFGSFPFIIYINDLPLFV